MRFIVLLIGIALAGSAVAQGQLALPPTINEITSEYDACVIVHHLQTNITIRNDTARCSHRVTPTSTFEVPLALIGLETGVIENERSVLTWEGSQYIAQGWDAEHSLASALHHSVVPYFQELAARVGQDDMQDNLDALDYGDRRIGVRYERFWLEHGLKVSPSEQVEFYTALYTDELPVAAEHQALVRSLLIEDYRPGRVLSGKMGSRWDGEHYSQGWYVGHLQSGADEYVFTIHIQRGRNPRGVVARALMTQILTEMGLY